MPTPNWSKNVPIAGDRSSWQKCELPKHESIRSVSLQPGILQSPKSLFGFLLKQQSASLIKILCFGGFRLTLLMNRLLCGLYTQRWGFWPTDTNQNGQCYQGVKYPTLRPCQRRAANTTRDPLPNASEKCSPPKPGPERFAGFHWDSWLSGIAIASTLGGSIHNSRVPVLELLQH